MKAKWLSNQCLEVTTLPRNVDAIYNRMMDILCDGPIFSETETEILSTLIFKMQDTFTETEICLPKNLDLCANSNKMWEFTYIKHPDGTFHRIILKKDTANVYQFYFDDGINGEFSSEFKCFSGEPDLERIMQGDFSRLTNGNCALKFNDIFRWAWESWRLAVGTEIGKIYPTLVQYMNFGAKRSGKYFHSL